MRRIRAALGTNPRSRPETGSPGVSRIALRIVLGLTGASRPRRYMRSFRISHQGTSTTVTISSSLRAQRSLRYFQWVEEDAGGQIRGRIPAISAFGGKLGREAQLQGPPRGLGGHLHGPRDVARVKKDQRVLLE